MNQETIEQVLRFREERNWKQFHNPKDLAISDFSGGSGTAGGFSVERDRRLVQREDG